MHGGKVGRRAWIQDGGIRNKFGVEEEQFVARICIGMRQVCGSIG